MKKTIFLITLLVFSSLFIGQARQWTEGNDVVYHVNVLNEENKNAKDLAVTVYIPDLGFFRRTTRFDLGHNDVVAKFVYDAKPKPGIYLTKISLSNSETGTLDTKYIYTLV